jgi:hypothetical protein
MHQAQMGGARPAPQSATEPYEQIQSRLSRSFFDGNWAITDNDVNQVHKQLDGLSPTDYKSTLNRMDQDGSLGTYIGEMNHGARDDFLEQAKDKGYLTADPGKDSEVPSNHPTPPRSPEMYNNTPDLPKSMRDAIHESNVDTYKEYTSDYRAYSSAVEKRILSCSSEQDIRDLGEPVDFHQRMEPGLKGGPFRQDWIQRTQVNTPTKLRTFAAVSSKQHDFNGEVRPGSLFVAAEASYKTKDDYGNTQLGGKVGGRLYDYGAVQAEAKGTASDIMGTPLSGDAGISGMRTPDGQYSVGPEASVNVSGGFDSKESRIGEVFPLSASVNNSGQVELGLDAFKADTPLGGAEIGSYASADPESSTIEMGLTGKIETRSGEVEAKVGFGMRGITADEILEAINGPGFYE